MPFTRAAGDSTPEVSPLGAIRPLRTGVRQRRCGWSYAQMQHPCNISLQLRSFHPYFTQAAVCEAQFGFRMICASVKLRI
jgi:hypothetical protein